MYRSRSEIGTGVSNTAVIIVAGAAQACANYTGGGYADWFLPYRKELDSLHSKLISTDLLLLSAEYWTSLEDAGASWPACGT